MATGGLSGSAGAPNTGATPEAAPRPTLSVWRGGKRIEIAAMIG